MISPLVLDKISNADENSSPRGIMCYFVPLDENWGIKVYYYKDERDKAYSYQKQCYELGGPAPQTGECFEVRCGDEIKYCYITERVKLLYDWDEQERWDSGGGSGWSPHAIASKDSEKQRIETRKEIQNLLNVYFADYHAHNFGIRKDGRFVCIDFGFN